MNVLYDHQAFSIQEYGGISRYFIELFYNLNLLQHIELKHTPQFSHNEYLSNYSKVAYSRFFLSNKKEWSPTLMRHINNLVGLATLATTKYDIFHPTYYDPYFLRAGIRKPFVITFHDMIHERFHRLYPELDTPLIEHKKRLLNESACVISVSESTKSDILNLYDVPEEKIKVIPLASSLQPPTNTPDSTLGEYLLYVGNRNLYKNFTFFLKAITPVLHKNPNLSLLCAGGGGFTAAEKETLISLKVTKQVKQVPIDDKELASLYVNAIAFVFPSLYEGFGIPTTEAMSCGCPVLASNVSSIPEVGADAALYFNPTDADSIREAVEKMLTDTTLRLHLKKRGKERAASFSWQNTAALTYEAYQSLI